MLPGAGLRPLEKREGYDANALRIIKFMESPLFLPTLRTDHELRKFSPSLQRVILSNAKDLLLRRPKQILHFIQDDILGATIAMVFMKSARAEESASFHLE